MSEACFLSKEPFFQCCCNCEFRLTDYKHCTIHGQPKGQCVCSDVKGYICAGFAPDRYYSEWSEHSIGCELYAPKSKAGED